MIKRLSQEEFENKWLPRISSICKDFNWEVRKAMTQNLESVFNRLEKQTELCDKYLSEELLELIDDEEE
ncbi:MAG: hypothetical protein HRT73_14305 [Flavobacteriales bacterium]|nr:hypothetical protein [Flavobacteriales bacterium]